MGHLGAKRVYIYIFWLSWTILPVWRKRTPLKTGQGQQRLKSSIMISYSDLTSQGKEFESKLYHQLEKLNGAHTYHQQTNRKNERFNRALLSMLRTLLDDRMSKWKDVVNKMVPAYNCTLNEVTGFSQFSLIFGRSPRLPVDLLFGTSSDVAKGNHTEYVK